MQRPTSHRLAVPRTKQKELSFNADQLKQPFYLFNYYLQ